MSGKDGTTEICSGELLRPSASVPVAELVTGELVGLRKDGDSPLVTFLSCGEAPRLLRVRSSSFAASKSARCSNRRESTPGGRRTTHG